MGGWTEVDIRALVPADHAAVGALFQAQTGRVADLELIASWIDEAPAATAIEAGEVVGFSFCRRFAPDVAEVANLLVAPSHRGRGVGAALLDAVEDAAPHAGYQAMIVVQSSLYRAGDGSAEVSSDPGGDALDPAERSDIYAHRGYRSVLTTGPTVVSVKGLVEG